MNRYELAALMANTLLSVYGSPFTVKSSDPALCAFVNSRGGMEFTDVELVEALAPAYGFGYEVEV